MKALPLEIRERIVAAYGSGDCTQEEVAESFGVCSRTVKRLWEQWRKQGHVKPGQVGGRRKPIIQGDALRRLKETVAARPDATLEELRAQCGVSCSLQTVANTLEREGYRRKKNAARR